jgi:thiol-activated cytolysin
MRNASPFKRLSTAALVSLALAGCAPGDPYVEEDTGNPIDDYIRAIGHMPETPAGVTPGMAQQDVQASNDEYACTKQNYSETRQYDKIVAFGANSDSLYAGAIVRGDSMYTGLFTQSNLPRRPMTISVSHPNLAGPRSGVMYSPSLSDYRETVAELLEPGVNGVTDANLAYTIDQVDSEKKLELAIGAKVSWGGGVGSVAASFNWNDTQKRTRMLVDFTQTFYTVDVDAPTYPSGFFGEDVTLADVKAEFSDNDPPLYVASISYGRRVIFTMETDFSEKEIKAALDFAFSAGAVNVDGSVSLRYDEMLNQTKITAFVLGGDAADAVVIFDNNFEGLKEFITGGANFDPRENPGAPIAYKLNYMADKSNARMSFTTDYENKECERISQRVKVTLISISCDDTNEWEGEIDAYGDITAQGMLADGLGQPVSLFHRTSGESIAIDKNSTYTGIMNDVIINVDPRPTRFIRLTGHLRDRDGVGNDDDLGTQNKDIEFEIGWRNQYSLTLSGSGARATLSFQLQPI